MFLCCGDSLSDMFEQQSVQMVGENDNQKGLDLSECVDFAIRAAAVMVSRRWADLPELTEIPLTKL